jgi:hypothetical protein
VPPEVLSADLDVEGLRGPLKQTELLREKNTSAAAAEPGKLIPHTFVYPPDRDCRLYKEATEMVREW